jgi:CDP-glycerol glycerophosphotransferase
MPKVSVIVPVYNAEKYLNQCLSTLANQTLKDIEIIVINDESNDSSLNIMEQWQKQYKDKFKIINQKNGGAGAARNRGLDIANGEFIKFVDADDYLKLDILEKMYSIAKENKVSLVRGNYQTMVGPLKINDKCSWSNINGNQIIDVSKNKNYIVTETPGIGNKLISRELLGNLRFPEKTKWEDLAIMPVVVASSERLFHMDEPVYNYRVNMNTTIKDFINKIPNILDIIKCVEILEQEMTKRNLQEQYKKQIESLYILHTLFRVENAMTWINFPKNKKTIVINSLINILDLKFPNWKDNVIIEEYKNINFLFKYNMNRLSSFQKEYENIDDVKELKKRIKNEMDN